MIHDCKTVRARITGRVQGVSFRDWTRREAERLGLSGWVRNEADGSVAALIMGPQAEVSTMMELLWDGPPAASVAGVETGEETIAETPAGFRIER